MLIGFFEGARLDFRALFWQFQVDYDFFKIKGWAFPLVENETFTMKVDDPNDFQRLALTYSERPYVMEEHGYLYTKAGIYVTA